MNELDLFVAALAISDRAERAALLQRECHGNAEMRQRIEALLAGNAESKNPLDVPIAGPPIDKTVTLNGNRQSATEDQVASTRVGTIIAGKYKLLQQIGEGGMGTVWMADQTEPIKRRVAVKLIRVERGNSATILARFEAERQAIALMDHPHIAKLLDAGQLSIEDCRLPIEHGSQSTINNRQSPIPGVPYFVMELVKGVPLTEFCDAHRLSIQHRLGLFQQICSAVQHAHQKGIIHRDLKPTNILVESHDGKPVPKIIDFGLAKATSGLQLTEHTMFTAFGSVMGTPLYMAPEQANFNAIDVDTRADIYALGVILYELLTGTTPLTRDTMKKAALDEMLKLVREQEAPTPSSRLSSAGSSPSVAANRQTEPSKLGRFVKGELDWIVLKALSKERDRRYETANGFAKDIERFLNHEPVSAGPPSARYKLRKFVRRNRGQVVAASAVFLTLIAGVVGTTLGLLEARRQTELARNEAVAKEQARAEEAKQRQIAEANEKQTQDEKAKAERNLAFAKKGNDLLGSVFAGLNPKQIAESGRPLQDILRENLGKAVQELEGSAIGDPLEVAAMQLTLGNSLLALGEAKLAVEVSEKARATRQALLGPDHPETISCVNLLAMAYDSAGKHDLALSLYEGTIKIVKSKLGPDHPITLEALNNMAECYKAAGKLGQALSLHEEVFKLAKAKYGLDHRDTLISLNNLANCYAEAGQRDKAVPLHEEAFKLTKAKFGPDHPSTLLSMNNLGNSYTEAGMSDKALPLLEEAFALMKVKLGPDHPLTLTALNNLALNLVDVGKLAQALPLFEESLRLTTAKLGPDHPSTLTCTMNLAGGYQTARKLDRALPLYEEALKLMKAKLGHDHPKTLHCMGNLANCYQDMGKLDLALPLYEETLRLMRAKHGADHASVFKIMNNLARGYWSLKKLDQSIPLFEELLSLMEKKLGRAHPDTQLTVANLGVNYKDAGRLKEALPLLEEAYTALNKNPSLRWVGSQLLDAYVKAGEAAKAAKLIERLLGDVRKALPKDSPPLAGQLAQFGMSLLEMKGYAEAEPLLRECLTIREKAQPDAWTTFNTQSMLGGALLGQKKYADAEPLLLAGYEGLKQREKTIPPPGQVRIPEAIERLVQLYEATSRPQEAARWRTVLNARKAAEKKP